MGTLIKELGALVSVLDGPTIGATHVLQLQQVPRRMAKKS